MTPTFPALGPLGLLPAPYTTSPMATLPAVRAAQDAPQGDKSATTASSLPTVRWTFRGAEPFVERIGERQVHAGADGAVYVNGRDQFLHALEAKTGEIRWRADASGWTVVSMKDDWARVF